MKYRYFKHLIVAILLLVVLSLTLAACGGQEAATKAPAKEPTAAVEKKEEPAKEEPKKEEPAQEEKAVTLAIEHFSIIEGTTWSGAHDRAGKRVAEKYPNVTYIYREEVGPDSTVPFGEELIAEGANIVIGNAEFMGMPLKDIADKYPDVTFGSVIASDLTSKANFIRFFPRQYQALYLEGLVAASLTKTGNIGVVSAFPSVQVIRRQAGFTLGVLDGAKLLNKDVNIYVKYVGDWYNPSEESEIAKTLIDQYKVDVLTQQSDSGSPLDVAEKSGIWYVGKDMDIVGEYGWSSTDTVAISFDTRWEIIYDQMVRDYMAGKASEAVMYPGMETSMTLADGTEVATVDIMNAGKTGVDAISPKADVDQKIKDLVAQRREEMMSGKWDPFTDHAFISNGTGLDLDGNPVPEKGKEVKAAGEAPTAEWLLSQFNFDLEGVTILE